MKEVILSRMHMENFKCFKDKLVDFAANRTTVVGDNGVGKSTLYSAVQFLLFDKNPNGSGATDIRPHDEAGNIMHFIDIMVEATFLVDGREITLKKTQKEKWVKKRGTETQTFQGNENIFSINEIPKSQADYKAYIEENICPEETFLACTNAQSFFKLDSKKRRAKLMELANSFTDSDVIDSNSDFYPLADKLKDGTVEELTTRSKGIVKRLNEELKLIPARIDEQEKSKVDIDLAELELGRNAIREKMQKIDEQLADVSKQLEEYQKASDGIMDLRFRISDYERNANTQIISERNQLDKEYRDCESQITEKQDYYDRISRSLTTVNENITKDTQHINELADKWKEANARVFDDSNLICPFCKQEYPEEKKAEYRADFETHKAKDIENITNKGNTLKKQILQNRETAHKYFENLGAAKKEIADLEEKRNTYVDRLNALPTSADLSGDVEYNSLLHELSVMESRLSKENSADGIRAGLNQEKQELQLELDKINSQINKASRNNDIDERIDTLKQEQRETAQKIADEEKTLALLEKFNKARMDMLTDSINKHFKLIKWRLFQPLLNGGYENVCQAIVNGSNYETSLNDSDCLLSELDMLETFQRMNDLKLPLFLDRAESVNPTRIPQTQSQLIMLRFEKDKELQVYEG